MPPTPEQIEAITRLVDNAGEITPGCDAQSWGAGFQTAHQMVLNILNNTAAAGVGDDDIVLDKNGTFWDRRFPNELIDHTIERCARLAKTRADELNAERERLIGTNREDDGTLSGRISIANDIYFSIRALKDKP